MGGLKPQKRPGRTRPCQFHPETNCLHDRSWSAGPVPAFSGSDAGGGRSPACQVRQRPGLVIPEEFQGPGLFGQ